MQTHNKAARRRYGTTLLLVVVTGVSGILFFQAARFGLAAYQLYSSLSAFTRVAANPLLLEPPVAASELRRVNQALDVLGADGSRLGPLIAPLLGAASAAPIVGDMASTAQDLLAVTNQSMALASALSTRLQPHLQAIPPGSAIAGGTEGSTLHDMLMLAAAAGADIAPFAPDFENLAVAATRVAAHEGLPPELRRRLGQVAQAARLGAGAAVLGPHLKWLLGMDSPRTLLLVAQNNDELRATGGFISAAGTITLDKGAIAIDNLVDSYAIYREDVDHPPPPPALQQYMKAYIWLFRDANWSPDAPEAAQTAADLYRLDTGVQVDGVLLLDTGALAHLVQALGAVTLPQREVTLTAADLEQRLIDLWNPQAAPAQAAPAQAAPAEAAPLGDWWEQRKDFVPLVAQAVLNELQSGEHDWLALASSVREAFDDRSLQLWVRDPAAAAALGALGWDGALDPQPNADFLAVVDSNVGFNKVDAVIARSLSYAVAWPAAGAAPTATLTITYTHPLSVTDPGCDQTPRYGGSYADLVARCYFDYIRVYVPAGSKLVASTGLQPGSTTSAVGEKGLEVFGGFLIQPPGTTHTVTFAYELPAALQPDSYALVLQRQAGTKPLPVALQAGHASAALVLDHGRTDWRPAAGTGVTAAN